MQLWTINALMQLTRDELCNLANKTECALREAGAGTTRRLDALTTLENIRRVMNWRGFHF